MRNEPKPKRPTILPMSDADVRAAQAKRQAGPIPASRLFPEPLPRWRVRLEWALIVVIVGVSLWAAYELFFNG